MEWVHNLSNVLTHWSVAQAGSNDEKSWGSKFSFDCPFKQKPRPIGNGSREYLNSIRFEKIFFDLFYVLHHVGHKKVLGILYFFIFLSNISLSQEM